jgi:uncharacterized membrane protein YgdD (TMEM256/DUF423 family)
MSRWFVFLGSLNGFLAVAMGAFGTHGLSGRISAEALRAFQTGADYQGVHALALLGTGLLARQQTWNVWLNAAGWCLFAGILLFTGSLYGLALSGIRDLGAITPVGGTLLLAGWLCLALGSLQRPTGGART